MLRRQPCGLSCWAPTHTSFPVQILVFPGETPSPQSFDPTLCSTPSLRAVHGAQHEGGRHGCPSSTAGLSPPASLSCHERPPIPGRPQASVLNPSSRQGPAVTQIENAPQTGDVQEGSPSSGKTGSPATMLTNPGREHGPWQRGWRHTVSQACATLSRLVVPPE